MASEFAYPCQHDLGVASLDTLVADYHPLTEEEIQYLLTRARGVGDLQARAEIQRRLCQGIPGWQCPHALETPVATAAYRISRLYGAWLQHPAADLATLVDTAQALYATMQAVQQSSVIPTPREHRAAG